MAKQTGFMKIRGTIGAVTFYKLNGRYYARGKSSLDRKRFMTDPAFAGSRESSRRFGAASALAKIIYRQLSPEKKRRYTIGKLTAEAGRMLHKGYTDAGVLEFLTGRYAGPSAAAMLQQANGKPGAVYGSFNNIPAFCATADSPLLLLQPGTESTRNRSS